MGKRRMSLLDLSLQTAKFNKTLVGSRVVNVYDTNNGRTYILKLSIAPKRHQNLQASSTDCEQPSKSVLSSSWEKKLLLIESGTRIHMTEFDREKDVPTGFSLKLRKHIRARRLDEIRQLGGDRILDLVFSGEGKVCNHLIVEVFSGGQIILTDENYVILGMLRNVKLQPGSEARIAIREQYPLGRARKQEPFTLASFHASVQKCLVNLPTEESIAAAQNRGFRKKLRGMTIARKALAVELSIEPAMLEHALHRSGLDSEITVKELADETKSNAMYQALEELQTDVAKLKKEGKTQGFVIMKQDGNSNAEGSEQYDGFSPYLYSHYSEKPYKEFNSFDEAADDYFSTLEVQRAAALQTKRQAAAFKKVDKLASELNVQLAAFDNTASTSLKKARAIESNVVEVEAAITVVRSAVAAAISWTNLADMVEQEKLNGNPVAEMIHSLQLDRNEITLMLEDNFEVDENYDDDDVDNDDAHSEEDGESSDEEDEIGTTPARKLGKSSAGTREVLLVAVDLSLSAYQNARHHYDHSKTAASKRDRAAERNDMTLKHASKKAVSEAQRLEAQAAAASIRARRRPFWFEKFYWFISSENFLVVAGQDVQQNELLVKRYLAPQDVFVTTDMESSSCIIVKNRKRKTASGTESYLGIPSLTLEQAGTFAMCRSLAWESKMKTSAWWVRATQVSKRSREGNYLQVGRFSFRGKKNYLNPSQLIMGLGFIFKIDESCVENHVGDRVVRGGEEEEIEEIISDSGKRGIEEVVVYKEASNVQGNVVEAEVVETGEEQKCDPDNDTEPITEGDTEDKIEAVTRNNVPETSGAGPSTTNNVSEIERAEGSNGAEGSVTKRSGKRHMSARERRALRNARKRGNSKPDTDAALSSTTPDANMTGVSESVEQKPKGQKQVRGKKHKLKRMRKYADQDEEERRIAIALLGTKPMLHERESEEEKEEVEEKQDKVWEKRAREEKEETPWMLQEEGVLELEKLQVETMSTLSQLTECPVKEDGIEFALAVCAPFSALGQFRYKVKLVPGNERRGKSYRSASMLLVKQAEKNEEQKDERDAMRLVSEIDAIRNMVSGVKIMAPGLANVQKALQKKKDAAVKKKKKK